MDAHTIEILIGTLGGIIASLIGILVWALKYSMKANREMQEEVHVTIDNHLTTETAAMQKLTEAIERLCTMWENGR